MKLKGADGLEDRLQAIKLVPRHIGTDWAEGYVAAARPMVAMRTGNTRASLRVGRIAGSRATVQGSYVLFFLDKGTKAHAIPKVRRRRSKKGPAKMLKFQAGGNTVFARKVDHPRTDAHPFRERASEESFRRKPMSRKVIELWNKAD